MKGLLISIVLFLLMYQHRSFAQADMMRLMNAANDLEDRGHLLASIDSTKKLSKLMPGSNIEVLCYNVAKMYGILNMPDSCFKYLALSFDQDIPLKVLTTPDFYHLTSDNRWRDIEERALLVYEAQNGPLENRELVKELLAMNLKDQAFYYEVDLIEREWEETEYLKYAIWTAKEFINNDNQDRLNKIIETGGWPDPNKIPKEASNAAFLVAQHCADLDKQIQFYEQYKSANYTDSGTTRNLAYMEDRINLRKGLLQHYGTQSAVNSDGESYLPDLFDPENLNARRESVGLEPIKNE